MGLNSPASTTLYASVIIMHKSSVDGHLRQMKVENR